MKNILNLKYRIPSENLSETDVYYYGIPLQVQLENDICKFLVFGEKESWNSQKFGESLTGKIEKVEYSKIEVGFFYEGDLKWIPITDIEIDTKVNIKIDPFKLKEVSTPYIKNIPIEFPESDKKEQTNWTPIDNEWTKIIFPFSENTSSGCAHDNCPKCHGTGQSDSGMCVHHLVCYCPKCSINC